MTRRQFVWLASVVLAGCASFSGRQSVRDPRVTPVTIDNPDPRFAPYLRLVGEKIRSNWPYPCVTNFATGRCDYVSASLLVEFGILKDGRVQLHDDAAVQAIRTASPFPEIPAEMMATMPKGSTGVPIVTRFKYVVETTPVR